MGDTLFEILLNDQGYYDAVMDEAKVASSKYTFADWLQDFVAEEVDFDKLKEGSILWAMVMESWRGIDWVALANDFMTYE